MPYEIPILIIPLTGGYFILSRSVLFRRRYETLSSQKLIFDSTIYGIFLLFGTYIFRQIIYYFCPQFFNSLDAFIRKFFFPHYAMLLGTALISFIFAISITYFINFIFERARRENLILINSIIKYGDELERFLLEATLNDKIISISLSNNKVYIGYAITSREPQKTNYVEILPLASGYRETENKILWLTTKYEAVIDAIKNKKELPYNNFKIVMNQNEIIATSFFDPEVYDKFHEQMRNK